MEKSSSYDIDSLYLNNVTFKIDNINKSCNISYRILENISYFVYIKVVINENKASITLRNLTCILSNANPNYNFISTLVDPDPIYVKKIIDIRYHLIDSILYLGDNVNIGLTIFNNNLYKDGNPSTIEYTVYNNMLFNYSSLATAIYDGIRYNNGIVFTGNYDGISYLNGYTYSVINYDNITLTKALTLNDQLLPYSWYRFQDNRNYLSISKTTANPSYTSSSNFIKYTSPVIQSESYLIYPQFNTGDFSNIILNFNFLQSPSYGDVGHRHEHSNDKSSINIIEDNKISDIKNNDGFIIKDSYDVIDRDNSSNYKKFNNHILAFSVAKNTKYRIFIKFVSGGTNANAVNANAENAISVINLIRTNYVNIDILTYKTILDRTVTGYNIRSNFLYMNNTQDLYITFNGSNVFYNGIFVSGDYTNYNFNNITSITDLYDINNFTSQSNWFGYLANNNPVKCFTLSYDEYNNNQNNWYYEKVLKINNVFLSDTYLFSPIFNANSNYVTFYFEFMPIVIRIDPQVKIGIIRSTNLSNISNCLITDNINRVIFSSKYQYSVTFKVKQNDPYFIFFKFKECEYYLRNFSIIHSPQSPPLISPVTDVFDVSDKFKFNNILYNLGMPNTGYTIYPISNGNLYLDSTLAQGYKKFRDPSDQKEYLYKDGYKHNGIYENLYYSNGTILTGFSPPPFNTLYISGVIPPNYYKHTDNKLYFNGVQAKGSVLYGDVLSKTELFIGGVKPESVEEYTVMNSIYIGGEYVRTTTASTSGDPYINTFEGFKYKLPNIIRTYRLLDFYMPYKDEKLIINASVSPLREEEKNMIMSIDKFKKHNPVINGFFYNEFYISTNNSYILLDRMFNLIKCSNITDFEITLENTPKLFKCDIQGESLYVAKIIYIFGVRIELRLFDNPQILNGIEISVPDIKNTTGLLSSRINPKNFMIKTITDTKKITIKSDKVYNRVVKENWIKVG